MSSAAGPHTVKAREHNLEKPKAAPLLQDDQRTGRTTVNKHINCLRHRDRDGRCR